MCYIGVDLGTTGCKSMAFGGDGSIIYESYFEYPLIQAGGFIEQDAEIWWTLVKRAIARSAAGCEGRGQIRGIGVSSQGISFVPLDGNGRALYRAISWLDNRPAAQTERIRKEFGDRSVFLRTGKRISSCYTLPKLMWLREEQPDVYRDTWKFLMGLDYITYRLTGRALTDHSMASGTMAYDVTALAWDGELLAACGVDAGKLPGVRDAGSPAGALEPAVAEELGLPGGLPVTLGAQDQKCAALGAGIGPGVATVSLGTATAVSTLCDRPVFDGRMRVPCFALGGGRWVLESVAGTTGASLKWLRDTLLEGMGYTDLTACAAQSAPGSGGVCFYPHMEGAGSPYWDSSARGGLQGLSLSTSRADIARAVLEGVAYQIAVNLGIHEEITGTAVREIRLFGGGAKSALWRRIIADVTGREIAVPYTSETANLGAAMLAGLGADACALPPGGRVQPDMAEHARCAERMGAYLEMQEKILNRRE